MTPIIRLTNRDDIAGLKAVLDRTKLFPSDMLPDMVAPFLSGEQSALWLTCLGEEGPVGLSYLVAEALTEGTWNMLALAVDPDHQGKGVGSAIVADAEARLKAQGQRLLIVDTSGTEAFARARQFYQKNGYEEEARIREFWAAGDDKITFRKAL